MDVADGDRHPERFEHERLVDARFRLVDLSDARFDQVDLRGVVMRGVRLVDVDIDGEVSNLVINGVEVGPLIEAELDRRHPDRAKMRPSAPEGLREAWAIIERSWAETVARARRIDPHLLHASVDDEWSFIQTLRHLVFATDSWIRRAILGEPRPWDPLALPHDEMEDTPGVPRDRDARPTLDEVLALREDRMATMRRVLADLTEEQLDSRTVPVTEPGWPGPESFAVRECLLCILDEEWHHRLYAERDLDVLESRSRERDTTSSDSGG